MTEAAVEGSVFDDAGTNDASDPVDTEGAPALVDGVAADSEETEAPALDMSTKVRVKIDGNEREVTLEELQKNYELRSASHKRFQETAALKKQIAERETQLTDLAHALRDPATLPHILRNLGHDPARVIEALRADAEVPAEERQAAERERALARREAEIKAFEKARENERMSAATKRAQERYTQEFNAALETHGLTGNVQMIGKMAEIMSTALANGYEVTAAEAAEEAIEELRGSTTRLLKDMTPEQLRKALGDEAVNALRSQQASAVKKPENRLKSPQRAKSAGEAPKKRRVRASEIGEGFFD